MTDDAATDSERLNVAARQPGQDLWRNDSPSPLARRTAPNGERLERDRRMPRHVAIFKVVNS